MFLILVLFHPPNRMIEALYYHVCKWLDAKPDVVKLVWLDKCLLGVLKSAFTFTIIHSQFLLPGHSHLKLMCLEGDYVLLRLKVERATTVFRLNVI